MAVTLLYIIISLEFQIYDVGIYAVSAITKNLVFKYILVQNICIVHFHIKSSKGFFFFSAKIERRILFSPMKVIFKKYVPVPEHYQKIVDCRFS